MRNFIPPFPKMLKRSFTQTGMTVLKNCFVITKELLKIIINKNDCPLAVIFILKLSFYGFDLSLYRFNGGAALRVSSEGAVFEVYCIENILFKDIGELLKLIKS